MDFNKKFKSKEALDHELHSHQDYYIHICVELGRTIRNAESIAVWAISNDDYAYLEEVEQAERTAIRQFIQYRDLLEPDYFALLPKDLLALVERLDYCLN